MSSSFDPDKSAGRASEQYSTPGETTQGEPHAEVLEDVLQQTRAAISHGETLEPHEMRALLQARRSFSNEPLSAESAAELVRSLLQARLGEGFAPAAFWQRMCRWIAETLLDDPESHRRLQALWTQLSEVPP